MLQVLGSEHSRLCLSCPRMLLGDEVSTPILNAILLLLMTTGVILLISCLWPASRPHEMPWTPREPERQCIRRFILPPDALRFNEPNLPLASTTKAASVVQRMSESFTPSARRQLQAWEYSWTFHPTTPAARDCTPLLVFINRGSGGRQGEAALLQMRALLSPQQAPFLPFITQPPMRPRPASVATRSRTACTTHQTCAMPSTISACELHGRSLI